MRVNIFTDGAAEGNPGPGGYGIVMEAKDLRKEFSGGFRRTTNNRMELLAIIEALGKLREAGHDIHIYSDSRYVVDAINKGWVYNWEKKAYAKRKNVDLWQRFMKLYRIYKPALHWVKGHNDHPQNERCDALAVQARKKKGLPADLPYEESSQ